MRTSKKIRQRCPTDLLHLPHFKGQRSSNVVFFIKYFFGVPNLATFISFFSLLYEPGLAVTGIDPGMTFTSFPSSIEQDLNPRPFDREPSLLPTRPDFRPSVSFLHYSSLMQ